jgi:GT2 family glycosyltransferase
MKQSIVITFHKNKDMLFFCLKRLLKTTPDDVEIIIVGNNINPEFLDFEIPYARCTYYKIYDNIQYPRAINFGVEKCHGEIITFVDADIFVWDNWYEPLLKMLTSEKYIGAVGSKLINPLNQRILDFGIMYSRFNSAHTLMGALYNNPLVMENRKVQALCSAILMTKKAIFNEVNGMDIEIPYAYTDCDYCIKLSEIGYESWAVAMSCAYHKGSTSKTNSKSGFSYLHSDAKGIFAMKDYAKLKYDITDWYMYAGAYTKKIYHDIASKYVLIDMTTLYDRKNYYSLIAQGLGVEYLDIIEIPNTQRDCEHLTLHDIISFNYLDLATPIIYFVDFFASLHDNYLWFSTRDISRDIVVDRHGNVVPAKFVHNKAY